VFVTVVAELPVKSIKVYEYGGEPPKSEIDTEPELSLHNEFVVETETFVNEFGVKTTVDAKKLHKPASVTLTEKLPAEIPVNV
jgi:hypothetical protein